MNSKRIEVNPIVKIFLIYNVTVIGYILFIKCFSIPVHIGVDEELYISMAKAFHYQGNFAKGGTILDYTCVLYSMILSLAYYFYSPENIVFVFRMIGVCVMLTSILPAYLLSRKLLNNEKKALVISVFVCILPSMMNVAYCMQEVLSYPLFLWIIYFVYKEIDEDVIDKITKNTISIIVLSVLCYFTKTYMIFLPIVYCLLLFFYAWENKKIAIWKKIFFTSAIYLLLMGSGNGLVLYINDGIEGANHYSSQFSNLFPITGETVGAAISCIILYFVALIFYWGILPVVLPVVNWKKHDKKDKYFVFFILVSFFVLVVEIVLSIVLTEEGNIFFPHKVLYRYFQILEIPLFITFIKHYKKYEIPKYIWAIYSFVLGTLCIYYVYIGKNQRTAIMDAPFFLLMENINRYVIPYFNVWTCIGCVIFIVVTYWLNRKKKITDVLSGFVKLTALGIGIFFIINLVQLPLYTNIIASGKVIEEDGIEIAHYCEENKKNYDTIYFVDTSDLFYERAINAYMKQEIVFLTEEEAETFEFEKAVIICSDAYEIQQEYREIEIDTQTVQVFEVN